MIQKIDIHTISYGSAPYGSSPFGAGINPGIGICPTSPKFSGDTVTLKATPKDGTGPYYVEFLKNGGLIDSSRLDGPNPIDPATENEQITRIYTLDDADIAGSGGTITFSVFISDKCPTGAKTCTETCTITIGCIAPVCNFTVT